MSEPPDGSGRGEPGDTRAHDETVLPTGEAVPVREARSRRKREDDIPPGTLLGGHYRVVRRLGGGAIGHVYEAINTWTTRRVAIKLLRAELVDDPDIAKRFLIEAQAATRVAHPHIVDILDMGKDPASGHLYIVQEFLEGRDLHAHLKLRGRLTVVEAAQVLLPVMHALAAAHEKGVLHRDLKPENVFLVQSPDGHNVPKVIDFGLARTEASANNRVTRTGALMGTPYYMSPEQARGESTIDARTDVWAIGVIWYEVIAGALPFNGDNLHMVLHDIFMTTPQRLDERVPEVPREIADAIHRAISRDLTVRYATMNDFIDALTDVLPDDPLPPSTLRSSRPGRISQTPPSGVASVNLAQSNTLPPPPPLAVVPLGASSTSLPPPESPGLSLDARRVRVLYVALGIAIGALLVVSVIAIRLLKRVDRGTVAQVVAVDAGRRAPHVVTAIGSDAGAPPDVTSPDARVAGDVGVDDAGEGPHAHHGRHHGDDEADDGAAHHHHHRH